MSRGRARRTPGGAEGGGGDDRRARFERGLGFGLDDFQKRAMDALDEGESVLVSAPTGSGKTVVADYAATLALERGGKAFYTTPIKALSNQKFAELARRYGQERVGLLTGDISYQPRASIVVMTTEVLRNMLFSRSPVLEGLDVVVLDEVHYLEDPYRGSVWEEVLVLTPPPVRFVSLSATVNNAADFGAWLRSIRGPTRVVVEDAPSGHAPPPLRPGRAAPGGDHPHPAPAGGPAQPRRHRPGPATPGRPAPSLPGPPAGRGRRAPGRSGHAPGHRVHLLAGGVRRCHPAVPARRSAAHHSRRAGPDPSADRGGGGAAGRRRPADPRVRTLVGGARGGGGSAPRRAGPGVPTGGRAVLLRGSVEGGVRHRDAGPRHQHARPDRRRRAIRQVPGGRRLVVDVGGVPAADRAGRPARHRHRRPRRGPLVAGGVLRRRGPDGRRPAARPGLLLPPHLQPGGQPGAPVVEGRGRGRRGLLLRAVAGRSPVGLPRRPARADG